MANIAIKNNSTNSVTYAGQVITAGSTFNTSSDAQTALFASDLSLRADVLGGLTTITVGDHTWNGDVAHKVLEVVANQSVFQTSGSSWPVKISNGTYNVDVTADGKLQVYLATPSAPPSGTAVSQLGDGNVGASGTIETVYTITNAKTLKIQRLSGGGENSVAGGRVELVYRPTGLAASDVLVEVGYIAGGNFQFQLDENFVGDGTKQIVLKRINGGGGTMRVTGKWVGYEI